MAEEEELQTFSEDEGLNQDPLSFTGFCKTDLFKSLLRRAKAITNLDLDKVSELIQSPGIQEGVTRYANKDHVLSHHAEDRGTIHSWMLSSSSIRNGVQVGLTPVHSYSEDVSVFDLNLLSII